MQGHGCVGVAVPVHCAGIRESDRYENIGIYMREMLHIYVYENKEPDISVLFPVMPKVLQHNSFYFAAEYSTMFCGRTLYLYINIYPYKFLFINT